MRNGVFKSAIYLASTAIIAVGGANVAAGLPFQLDRQAFERIHHPTERRAALGMMARPSNAPGRDSVIDAGVAPLGSGWDGPVKADDEVRLVRFRPSNRVSKRRGQSFEAEVFVATPAGRPIFDAYDFAGVDPQGFAPITPVEMKRATRQRQPEKTRAPADKKSKKRMTRPRQPEPTRRGTLPLRQPNEALDLSVRTLDYVVLTAKMFVENLARILNIFL